MTSRRRRPRPRPRRASPLPPQTPPAAAVAMDEPLDLDQVYRLITDRASGRASNDEVEQAVSKLLSQHRDQVQAEERLTNNTSKTSRSTTAHSSSSWQEPEQQQQQKPDPPSFSRKRPASALEEPEATAGIIVQEDLGDYDNDDENDKNEDFGGGGGGGGGGDDCGSTKKISWSHHSSEATGGTAKTSVRQAPPRKRSEEQQQPQHKQQQGELDLSLYDEIPMGRQGARMMIVFGDGRRPDPLVVRATLLGTRRMMLVAIQDARHLRRKHYATYQQAKMALERRGGASVSFISQQLLYQLQQQKEDRMTAKRRVRNSSTSPPPCGFGPEDLIQLFPEEMNAYIRWEQMKEEVDDKQQNTVANTATNTRTQQQQHATEDNPDHTVASRPNNKTLNGNVDDSQEDEEEEEEDNSPFAGKVTEEGHLRERAQTFDVRTSRMKRDWYLKFSHVRHQGSFLPRRGGRPDSNTIEWEQQQQSPSTGRRGRPSGGGGGAASWALMSFAEVRFLHWLGFDPTASTKTTTNNAGGNEEAEEEEHGREEHFALPPPNAETTGILAYLAHDFFGRIVEKAVTLRKEQLGKMTEGCLDGDNDEEEDAEDDDDEEETQKSLHSNMQLSEQDIARAMEHAEIKPIPIFGSNTTKGSTNNSKKKTKHVVVGTQLYFGPGFEDRVELELEELARGGKNKREGKENEQNEVETEEMKWRIREDLRFERWAAMLPSLEDELLQQQPQEQQEETTAAAPAAKEQQQEETTTTDNVAAIETNGQQGTDLTAAEMEESVPSTEATTTVELGESISAENQRTAAAMYVSTAIPTAVAAAEAEHEAAAAGVGATTTTMEKLNVPGDETTTLVDSMTVPIPEEFANTEVTEL